LRAQRPAHRVRRGRRRPVVLRDRAGARPGRRDPGPDRGRDGRACGPGAGRDLPGDAAGKPERRVLAVPGRL